MSTLRKVARGVAHTKMKKDGIIHINKKHKDPIINNLGQAAYVDCWSTFSRHWREYC